MNPVLLTADDRARLSLTRLKVRSGDTFRAEHQPDGRIVLTPMTSIPARELMIWANPELRASLLTGIVQAADGQATANQEMEADLAALGAEHEAR
ncbi:MAG: hypothetical protein LBU05_06430 [Bifidobacteriaceae bacterium]|jgi:hypothetical protein|nr:hypothetical protein [Bifidobacteriaceae bacterium]